MKRRRVRKNPSAARRRATARNRLLKKAVAASRRNMRAKKARTLYAALKAQGLLLTTSAHKVFGLKSRKGKAISRGYLQETRRKRNPSGNDDGSGKDIRQGPPRVIRTPRHISGPVVRYSIVGTGYGYLHDIDGSVAVWKTRSGAQAALRRRFGKTKRNPELDTKGKKGSKALALKILDWHGGQGSDCYLVGSNWHSGKAVSATYVLGCIRELERSKAMVQDYIDNKRRGYTRRDLKQLQGIIAAIKRKF